jgi:hypothetical protein
MTELGQLIDHAAELRRELDRLEREVQILALSLFALMLAVGLLTWQAWRED